MKASPALGVHGGAAAPPDAERSEGTGGGRARAQPPAGRLIEAGALGGRRRGRSCDGGRAGAERRLRLLSERRRRGRDGRGRDGGGRLRAGAVAAVGMCGIPSRRRARCSSQGRHVLLVAAARPPSRASGVEGSRPRRARLCRRGARRPPDQDADTVGAVCRDAERPLGRRRLDRAACPASSCTPCDAPLPGCGLYADDTLGAVCATGRGEGFMRLCLCYAAARGLGAGDDAGEVATSSSSGLHARLVRRRSAAVSVSTVRRPWPCQRPSSWRGPAGRCEQRVPCERMGGGCVRARRASAARSGSGCQNPGAIPDARSLFAIRARSPRDRARHRPDPHPPSTGTRSLEPTLVIASGDTVTSISRWRVRGQVATRRALRGHVRSD